MRTKTKADPDVRGFEYRVAMIQTDAEVRQLQGLSHRGWQVHVALSPSKVLLRRGEGWND